MKVELEVEKTINGNEKYENCDMEVKRTQGS